MDEYLARDFGGCGICQHPDAAPKAPKAAASSLLEAGIDLLGTLGMGCCSRLAKGTSRQEYLPDKSTFSAAWECSTCQNGPGMEIPLSVRKSSSSAWSGVAAETSIDLLRVPRGKAALKRVGMTEMVEFFPYGNAGQSINHGIN